MLAHLRRCTLIARDDQENQLAKVPEVLEAYQEVERSIHAMRSAMSEMKTRTLARSGISLEGA